MHVSVEASLKKLRTDYIDILYVHWWDYDTPIEEVMNGLHNLVTSGKVLYLVRLSSHFRPLHYRLTNNTIGNIRYASMGRLQSEHLCKAHWKDSVRHLSRLLEYPFPRS